MQGGHDLEKWVSDKQGVEGVVSVHVSWSDLGDLSL